MLHTLTCNVFDTEAFRAELPRLLPIFGTRTCFAYAPFPAYRPLLLDAYTVRINNLQPTGVMRLRIDLYADKETVREACGDLGDSTEAYAEHCRQRLIQQFAQLRLLLARHMTADQSVTEQPCQNPDNPDFAELRVSQDRLSIQQDIRDRRIANCYRAFCELARPAVYPGVSLGTATLVATAVRACRDGDTTEYTDSPPQRLYDVLQYRDLMAMAPAAVALLPQPTTTTAATRPSRLATQSAAVQLAGQTRAENRQRDVLSAIDWDNTEIWCYLDQSGMRHIAIAQMEDHYLYQTLDWIVQSCVPLHAAARVDYRDPRQPPALLAKTWLAKQPLFRAMAHQSIRRGLAFSPLVYRFLQSYLDKDYVFTAAEASPAWRDPVAIATQRSVIAAFSQEPVKPPDPLRDFGRNFRRLEL